MANVVAVRERDGSAGADHAHMRNESLVDLIDDGRIVAVPGAAESSGSKTTMASTAGSPDEVAT
jgi:hypothetical protein